MFENPFFPELKGNFGFGFMRLPMTDGKVDIPQSSEMVDAFMASGFNYFDTAHGYIDGQSETALRECLVRRYPRESYILTNKLTRSYIERQEDIVPLFEKQLEACGVSYFDFYLIHSVHRSSYEKFKACRAFETVLELKAQGRIRHFGISFHDRADVLERILTEWPQIEVVQIQFNYIDYEDATVESRKVYEVCERFGKPVIVMEPVKGGSLVKLPEAASQVFDSLGTGMSSASYAIRFAAGFKNIAMVLSGMSDLAQVHDNTAYMADFKPLDATERAAVDRVCAIFRSMDTIPCTRCRYCVTENACPMNILIPEVFSCYNDKLVFQSWNQDFYYEDILTRDNGKASDCIGCGGCEEVCPQHLSIRKLLKKAADEFEKEQAE